MYKLFPYQQKLVNQARQILANGSKSVLIQSPAGSGKSVIIAEIARLAVNKGGHVMFTVHRRELIEQITQSFKKQDVDLSHCTIMTVRRIANRLGKLPQPTLLITDETHHGLAKTYRKIYKYYASVPRLGFTATPWRMNGEALHQIYDQIILGPTVDWLIEHKFLAPAHYYTVDLADHSKLKSNGKHSDYTNKSIDDSLGKTIFGDVVSKWQQFANGRKTIVYAHSIAYSRSITEEFQNHGIKACHVDNHTPAKERQQIMQAFKTGKIKVLCNIDLISEGFDVPDCSCVIMVRPTKSLVLFIQQAMRCMRSDHQGPNGGNLKKHATIIDMVGNAEQNKALPQSNIDWEASFMGHPQKGKEPTVCQHCYSSFFASKDLKAKRVIDDENTELKRWEPTVPNNVIREWLQRHDPDHTDQAESITMCPLCRQIAESNPIARQQKKKAKEKSDGQYIDLSDPKVRKRWELEHVAQRSTRGLKGAKSIYRIFAARKQLNPQSTKKPVFQTLFVLMNQATDNRLTTHQIAQLADASGQDFSQIRQSYLWAQQHWTFSTQPHYEFNF